MLDLALRCIPATQRRTAAGMADRRRGGDELDVVAAT